MKENQRIVLTKRMLKEGIMRLLQKKALEKITITELCAESGINRTTFYHHYDIPRDVLIDLQRDIIGSICNSYTIPKSKTEAESYLESLLTQLYDNADMLRIFIKYNSLDDVTGLLNNFFEDCLNQYSIIPELQDLDRDSLRLICSYMSGGGYFLIRQWLIDGVQKTPKEIAQLVWRFTKANISLR